jgi:hypothetical protein
MNELPVFKDQVRPSPATAIAARGEQEEEESAPLSPPPP